MTLDEKVDDLRDAIHELKPMLAAVSKMVESQELRLRFLELRGEQHDVKIQHIERNFDGLAIKHRKLDAAIRGGSTLDGEAGFLVKVGTFIIENWRLLCFIGIFGTGTLVVVYNFVVNLLHHLPLLPAPHIPVP